MKRRVLGAALLLLTGVAAAGWLPPAPAGAVNQLVLRNPAVQRGRDIARRNCAGCHSVSLKAPSLHRAAPPFRELGDRHTPESLRAAVADAVASDHHDMPPIYLSAEEARDVEAFLTAFAHADKKTARRLSLPSCFLRRC